LAECVSMRRYFVSADELVCKKRHVTHTAAAIEENAPAAAAARHVYATHQPSRRADSRLCLQVTLNIMLAGVARRISLPAVGHLTDSRAAAKQQACFVCSDNKRRRRRLLLLLLLRRGEDVLRLRCRGVFIRERYVPV